ncbi:MAG: hemin uptake protein HemP [Planctomycetales bacterium]|nr:hemin uptake protein HemP [Planctomycetales bacterium]
MGSNEQQPVSRDNKDVVPVEPRVLNSQDLLQGAKEVLISHHGEIYRLRETRNGKLILGK